MVKLIHDRGEIIDFTGRQEGSPALASDGAPTLVTGHATAEAKRVGWPAFFAAMSARHLALRVDTETQAWTFVDRHAPPEATPAAP